MNRFAIAGAVLAALALAACGGDDERREARMTLEQSVSPTGLGEVLVSVTGDAKLAKGAKDVSLECVDDSGQPVTSARYPWPLQRDGQDPRPHIHQAAAPSELRRIRRCRIGTSPALTANLPLR